MNVKNALIKAAATTRFFAIKNAPELLLAGGFIAGAAGIYFACKGTVSAREVIERHNEAIEEIHEAERIADPGEFPPEAVRVNLVRAYGKTAWELFKVYSPAIIFVTLSVVCILTSHGILKRRNLVLASSLAAVRASFDEYRERVRRDLGDEQDEHFLYDTEAKEVKTEEVNEETGKKQTKKQKYNVPTKLTPYARFYDEAAKWWSKDPGKNFQFVRGKMVALQEKLIIEGHLFLNDVYKALGLPITVAGQSAGWIYDPNNKNGTLIGFKGFDPFGGGYNLSDNVRAFMNGYERNCLIDFVNLKDDILTDLPRVDNKVATV